MKGQENDKYELLKHITGMKFIINNTVGVTSIKVSGHSFNNLFCTVYLLDAINE